MPVNEMSINATILGQMIVGWSLVYMVTCYFLTRHFNLPKVVMLVGILLVPFIPLTPVYLIVLIVLGMRSHELRASTTVNKRAE